MFHQTLWEADGDITNLEIQALQGQRFRDAQIELLHRCTGQDKRILRTDIERDHYMSSQEALEYGLIDKIIRHKGAPQGSKRSNGRSVSAQSSASNSIPMSAKLNGKRGKGKSAAKVSKRATADKSGRR
jgi:hypothetical protein